MGLRRLSLKIFLLLLTITSVKITAKEVQNAPDAKNWAETFDRSKLDPRFVPGTILVLESITKATAGSVKIVPLEFNSAMCGQVSFISCVDGSDFLFSLKINKVPLMIKDDELAKFVGASGLIYSDGSQVVVSINGSAEKIAIARAPKLNKSLDARRLFDRLLTTLGYDGVVLDIKGDYLLVGTFDARLKRPDLQGLLIKNSAESISIQSKSASEGAALLSLVANYGGYAVFKSIIGADSVQLGQKILIERHR